MEHLPFWVNERTHWAMFNSYFDITGSWFTTKILWAVFKTAGCLKSNAADFFTTFMKTYEDLVGPILKQLIPSRIHIKHPPEVITVWDSDFTFPFFGDFYIYLDGRNEANKHRFKAALHAWLLVYILYKKMYAQSWRRNLAHENPNIATSRTRLFGNQPWLVQDLPAIFAITMNASLFFIIVSH